jgi:hypothetical protein
VKPNLRMQPTAAGAMMSRRGRSGSVSPSRSAAVLPVARSTASMGHRDDLHVAWPHPVQHDVGDASDDKLAHGRPAPTR